MSNLNPDARLLGTHETKMAAPFRKRKILTILRKILLRNCEQSTQSHCLPPPPLINTITDNWKKKNRSDLLPRWYIYLIESYCRENFIFPAVLSGEVVAGPVSASFSSLCK